VLAVNRFQIERACVGIRNGDVIAYPTEAVWGLGCDPFDQFAIERLLQLKQRPIEKGLILVSGDISHFSCFVQPLSEIKQEKLRNTWPGPVTWLLPDAIGLPYWIKGKHEKIALRVTKHPLVMALTRRLGGPIISTSANPAGKPPAHTSLRVRQYFGHHVDYILPGSLGQNEKPTPIYDIDTSIALRT